MIEYCDSELEQIKGNIGQIIMAAKLDRLGFCKTTREDGTEVTLLCAIGGDLLNPDVENIVPYAELFPKNTNPYALYEAPSCATVVVPMDDVQKPNFSQN
jgi:hypothetical protein